MKTTTLKVTMFVAGLVASGLLLAGTLDPPGPPAPTMVTLQDIYDRLGVNAPIPKTGQTACWDSAGTSISCTGTGQDGDLRKGVSTPLRFVDNGDGTVKDNQTGLTWLKNGNCFGLRTWSQALADANGLASPSCGLADGSTAGAWRLPNIRELHSLIDYSRINPALPLAQPFTNLVNNYYWSGTNAMDFPTAAWGMNVGSAAVDRTPKTFTQYVWPVRGGQ